LGSVPEELVTRIYVYSCYYGGDCGVISK